MKIINVGPWKITVGEPHPCWVTVSHVQLDKDVGRFRHDELRDLEYAIGRAIHAAREMMPDSHKHEMD